MEKKSIYKNGLLLLITFHLLNIFQWLELNIWPMGKDYFWHMNWAHYMGQNLEKAFTFRNLFFISTDYPVLYYWISIALTRLGGTFQAAFLSSTVFFCILLLSTYGIGSQLKNRQTGFIAAYLCSLFPIVYSSSIEFNLAIATAAMVSSSIYFLLKTQNFSHRIYSVIAGIALGLALLTRQFVILFIAGPLLILILSAYFKSKKGDISAQLMISNLVIFSMTAFLIAGYFYLNKEIYPNMIRRMHIIGQVSDLNILSSAHLLFYMKALWSQIGGIGVTCLLLSSLHFKSFRKQARNILLSWIIPPLLIFTFIFLKYEEYTISYLPAISIIIALAINEIKHPWIQKIIGVSIFIISMCFYFKNF